MFCEINSLFTARAIRLLLCLLLQEVVLAKVEVDFLTDP